MYTNISIIILVCKNKKIVKNVVNLFKLCIYNRKKANGREGIDKTCLHIQLYFIIFLN
jgi:hypothetical protein